MRKTILAILGVGLIVASTAQIAASEHHARKTACAPTSTDQQFRNAKNSATWSDLPNAYYNGGLSAPAGR